MALFLVTEFLLLVSIQSPSFQYFDEIHYVRAAKQIFEFVPNKNIEHPPLAKEFIGFGILIFGDNPVGWRFMSVFFGALTIAGVYLWAFAIFKTSKAGLIAALTMLLNQLFFVESRLAVIDPFMEAFLVWAMAAFCFAFGRERNKTSARYSLMFAGVCFGLAMACKWSVIPMYVFCVLVAIVSMYSARTGKKTFLPYLSPEIGMAVTLLALVVLPATAYFISFAPYFFVDSPGYRLVDFWIMQSNIWTAQMLTPGTNPYHSSWYEWPLMLKPYWYLFSPDQVAKTVRGVLLIGNPVIIFSGLIALIICFYHWILAKSAAAFLILLSFMGLWLFPWCILQREASYFYYYYPASSVLSLAIAFVFTEGSVNSSRLIHKTLILYFVLAAICFAVFYPLLSYMEIQMEFFQRVLFHWLPPIYTWKVEVVP